MANSLFERWHGGLWAGAIGGAIAQANGMAESPSESLTEPLTDMARVQDLILSDILRDRISDAELDAELDGDEALALDVALEAMRRSAGDWTVAFPWATGRSPNPWLTGIWLGTLLGINGGSRSIPIELRVAHRDLGIQLRSIAEARVRSYSGISARVLPLLMPRHQ